MTSEQSEQGRWHRNPWLEGRPFCQCADGQHRAADSLLYRDQLLYLNALEAERDGWRQRFEDEAHDFAALNEEANKLRNERDALRKEVKKLTELPEQGHTPMERAMLWHVHRLMTERDKADDKADILTQKLAAAESAIADMVANIRRIDSHDEGAIPWAWFIRWADALTPSEKGD